MDTLFRPIQYSGKIAWIPRVEPTGSTGERRSRQKQSGQSTGDQAEKETDDKVELELKQAEVRVRSEQIGLENENSQHQHADERILPRSEDTAEEVEKPGDRVCTLLGGKIDCKA